MREHRGNTVFLCFSQNLLIEENEMMNTGYPVYREPSPAERREIDKRNGELAAALARSLRRLATGVHHKMSRRNRGKTSKVPLVALTRSREV
jgi:hypothetical protein